LARQPASPPACQASHPASSKVGKRENYIEDTFCLV